MILTSLAFRSVCVIFCNRSFKASTLFVFAAIIRAVTPSAYRFKAEFTEMPATKIKGRTVLCEIFTLCANRAATDSAFSDIVACIMGVQPFIYWQFDVIQTLIDTQLWRWLLTSTTSPFAPASRRSWRVFDCPEPTAISKGVVPEKSTSSVLGSTPSVSSRITSFSLPVRAAVPR